MEESNIINNSQASSSSYGTIYNCHSSTVTINKCCLIKNNEIGYGKYLFYANSGYIIDVKECTIQSGYSIAGSVTTSYSNTEAGSECAAINNCGTKNVNINKEDKCKCTICDFEILHKLQQLYLNKQFYYK
jgi:hypothetical protein